MSVSFKDADARIQKTNEALLMSMSKLLDLRNFNQITVHDLCLEAEIARATFCSHYLDKYDLLKYWLNMQEPMVLIAVILTALSEYRSTPLGLSLRPRT